LAELAGDDPGLDSLKRLLIERTEGNPLFLEESIRTLVEAGALAGERGAYHLARPVDSIRVPATVQTVLAARIDRLGPEVKRLLQAAAVIGKDVPFALLRAIGALDEASLRRDLAQLQAAELLYEASLFPELEYTFKHALTHEVAYDSLLHDRRRATHGSVLEAMEHLYVDRQSELIERLAYHALRGEVWERALSYARQAGQKAVQRSALPQAAAHFEQALTALQHLPESRATLEQAVDLRLDLRSALYPQGEFGRIVERLREAEAIAAALDDQGRLARLAAYLASSLNTMGSHALAVAPAQRALAIGVAQQDLGARVLGNHFLGLAYHALGSYGLAVECLRRNVGLLRDDLLGERFGMHGSMSVFSRSPLIWCLAELGEFPEANSLDRESFQIAEAVNHAPTLGGAYMGASLLHVRSGDLETGIEVAERGLEHCRTWGLRAVYPYVVAQLGYGLVLSGRPAAGLPHLNEALESAAAVGHLRTYALFVLWRAEAHLAADNSAQAIDDCQRALNLARQQGERGTEAWALRLLAEIAARRRRPQVEQAEQAYGQAVALATELGMRPLQAHCQAGLGGLYRRLGRFDAARLALSGALAAYRALGLQLWLTSAQSELESLS
jgi:tetratricopeptide (TPR) repeat protein